MSESDNWAALESEAQQLVEAAHRLRQWAFASVALSAVAFVVSLVAVFA